MSCLVVLHALSWTPNIAHNCAGNEQLHHAAGAAAQLEITGCACHPVDKDTARAKPAQHSPKGSGSKALIHRSQQRWQKHHELGRELLHTWNTDDRSCGALRNFPPPHVMLTAVLLWFLGCFIPEIAGLSLTRYVRDYRASFIHTPLWTSSSSAVMWLFSLCQHHPLLWWHFCSKWVEPRQPAALLIHTWSRGDAHIIIAIICNSSLWCFVPSPLFLTFIGVSEPICC